jgi:nucleoside-diphosphate-sugar epimerase
MPTNSSTRPSALPWRRRSSGSDATALRKARALLGWEPTVALDEGLERTITCFGKLVPEMVEAWK